MLAAVTWKGTHKVSSKLVQGNKGGKMCHHLKAVHFWKVVQLLPLTSNLSIGATPSPQVLKKFYCQNLSDADPNFTQSIF